MNTLQIKKLTNIGLSMNDIYSTTEISNFIGFHVQAKFIEDCGIAPILKTHTGVYWLKCDLNNILISIAKHMLDKIINTNITDGIK